VQFAYTRIVNVLRQRNRTWIAVLSVVLVTVPGRSDIGSTTQTLAADIYPIGSVSVTPTVSLFTSGTTFQAYSGNLTVNYQIRTTGPGGGTVTVKANSEFSPSGGPTIAAGLLTYTCGGATLGAACSGSQTVSTSSQTPVLTVPGGVCTGGGGACSSADPNSVSLNLGLANRPSHKSGTYTTSLLITISAT
jgi:hypothetical protein